MNMTMSDNGVKLLHDWEGFKKHVYLDSGGAPTIGMGHLLTKAERSSGKITIDGETIKYVGGLSGQKIMSLLKQDLQPVEELVNKLVVVPLEQCQFDALVSFAFNVGNGAFKHSTLLKSLNAKLYDRVPEQLKRWVHDGGLVVPGLQRRRGNEVKLWHGLV